MLISEAFDAYRDNYIRFKNQSSRTEEIHEACKRLFLLSVPDKPVDQLTLEDIRRWHDDIAKGRRANSVLKNNGNMRYLSAMLGHASLDTTMMYAHVVDHDLQRQYEKYHTI